MTSVRARMAVSVAGWLAFAAPAHGEPKCLVLEQTVHGISRDGRFALTSSNDHFGLIDVALVDLQEGRDLLGGHVSESAFESLNPSELLDAGRLELRPPARRSTAADSTL